MKSIKENLKHFNFINLHHTFHSSSATYVNMNTFDSIKEPRKAALKPSSNQDSAIRKISQPPAIFSARLPAKKTLASKQEKIISQHNEEETEFVMECFSRMFWDDAEDKQDEDKDDNDEDNKEMIKNISDIEKSRLAEKMTGKDNDRRMFRKELAEMQKVGRKPWNYGSKGRWTL